MSPFIGFAMSIFSYHLVNTSVATACGAMMASPWLNRVPGLRHAECMTSMVLGSSIFSTQRLRLEQLAVFARWDEEAALEDYLRSSRLGWVLANGWHVRLDFIRRWGHLDALRDLPESVRTISDDAPVVAVTVARMKMLQVPRFVRWGKPVERFVRDAPGVTMATAAIRPLRTVSTFSVWQTQRDMLAMVWGKERRVQGSGDAREGDEVQGRHAAAMKERSRKDFHTEFTTLRFVARSEHGHWCGRHGYVPGL